MKEIYTLRAKGKNSIVVYSFSELVWKKNGKSKKAST